MRGLRLSRKAQTEKTKKNTNFNSVINKANCRRGCAFYDRMMLRKRYIIKTINDMLKNTAQIVHSRHISVSNFIMNLISALGAYCFFDNKPKALQGYCIEDTKQLTLF